ANQSSTDRVLVEASSIAAFASIRPSDFIQEMPMMVNGRLLAFLISALFALPSGTEPWDKPPEQWDLADSYKILRDSPWTPSVTKLEANFTLRHTDKLTGLVIDSPSNTTDT